MAYVHLLITIIDICMLIQQR